MASRGAASRRGTVGWTARVDNQTLQTYGTVGLGGAAVGSMLTTAFFKWREWRVEHGLTVKVRASLGLLDPSGTSAAFVTVENPSPHPVTVTGVGLELSDGTGRVGWKRTIERGPRNPIPGIVPPRDEGMTWYDLDELLEQGLNRSKPVRARVTIGGRGGPLRSPRPWLPKVK